MAAQWPPPEHAHSRQLCTVLRVGFSRHDFPDDYVAHVRVKAAHPLSSTLIRMLLATCRLKHAISA
eukprot:1160525-Pelagomonas_calceolata.AAC.9